MSRMSLQGSQLAKTPKVSIGTVEERAHFTRRESLCGLMAKSLSTSPHTNVLSSSTLEPCGSCTRLAPGAIASSPRGPHGTRARVGDDRGNPFAGIARDFEGKRPARHVWRIKTGHQWQRGGSKLSPVENVMHAGRGERCFLVDRFDAGGGVGAGDQRHMFHVGQVNVGDELPFAGDEAAILPYAAIGGD